MISFMNLYNFFLINFASGSESQVYITTTLYTLYQEKNFIPKKFNCRLLCIHYTKSTVKYSNVLRCDSFILIFRP